MTLHHSPKPAELNLVQQAQDLLGAKEIKLSAGEASVTLPPDLATFLRDLLTRLGNGESLTVFSDDEELTTTQAAELLRVSRPYLVGLLDERKIPHRKVGKHRRIRVRDLLEFQRQDLAERQAIARQITALWQEMDPY